MFVKSKACLGILEIGARVDVLLVLTIAYLQHLTLLTNIDNFEIHVCLVVSASNEQFVKINTEAPGLCDTY